MTKRMKGLDEPKNGSETVPSSAQQLILILNNHALANVFNSITEFRATNWIAARLECLQGSLPTLY